MKRYIDVVLSFVFVGLILLGGVVFATHTYQTRDERIASETVNAFQKAFGFAPLPSGNQKREDVRSHVVATLVSTHNDLVLLKEQIANLQKQLNVPPATTPQDAIRIADLEKLSDDLADKEAALQSNFDSDCVLASAVGFKYDVAAIGGMTDQNDLLYIIGDEEARDDFVGDFP